MVLFEFGFNLLKKDLHQDTRYSIELDEKDFSSTIELHTHSMKNLIWKKGFCQHPSSHAAEPM